MKNNNTGKAIGIGVGVAAAAAAAAGGAYWLYGSKHSAQHRKMAKSWMLKARAEVMEAIEKLEDVDKERYFAIVNDVLKNYTGAAPKELASMQKDFKAAWTHMAGKTTKGKGVKKSSSKASRKPRRPRSKK